LAQVPSGAWWVPGSRKAGDDVTFLVRGANLEAIAARGVKLIEKDGYRAHRAQRPRDRRLRKGRPAGRVVLAVKANQVDAVAPQLHALFGAETVVVTMQNGIPFWYFHRHAGPLEGRQVKSVDPTGRLIEFIPAARLIGCVVYPASDLVAPGVIRHVEGNRLPLGELDGSRSERGQRVAAAFEVAGFKAPVLEDIRSEIWLKLWGNLTFNPISALSHSTLEDICRYPLTRDLAASMMGEAERVAGKLGISFRVSLEKRIAGAESVGAHKTSMLQDIEAGRAPEIDALVGSVIELARHTDTPTPHIDAVYALVKLLSTTLERRQGRLQVA
jgi:2-dehydropantoate 2-reductase